jgi:hypothetical protein
MSMNWTLIRALSFSCLFLSAGVDHALGMSEEMKKAVLEELHRLQSADPTSDVEAAFRQGDFRFVGLMGYSLEVPGVDPKEFYEKYSSEFGVKVIRGTSDFMEIPEQLELARIGGDYAQQYNQLLIKKIAGRSFQELIRDTMKNR